MEMFGNIRCVTFAELVTQGGILSEPNYKKKVREGKIRPLTIGGNGRKVLRFPLQTYQRRLRRQIPGRGTTDERTNQSRNHE